MLRHAREPTQPRIARLCVVRSRSTSEPPAWARARGRRRRGAFTLIETNRAHLRPGCRSWPDARVADSLAFIRAARPVRRQPGHQLALLVDERIIGVAGFTRIDWREVDEHRLLAAAERQGAGTMTAAVCALLDHAFERWGLGASRSAPASSTRAVARSRSGFGFREEGVLRSAERNRDARDRPRVYVMTAREWRRRARELARAPGTPAARGAGSQLNARFSRAPSAAGRIVG